MDMSAEGDVGIGRRNAARGVRRIAHIVPSRRMRGFRMHVEAIVFLPRQRQLGEKTPLRPALLAARPLDRGLGHGVHAF